MAAKQWIKKYKFKKIYTPGGQFAVQLAVRRAANSASRRGGAPVPDGRFGEYRVWGQSNGGGAYGRLGKCKGVAEFLRGQLGVQKGGQVTMEANCPGEGG